MKTFTVDEARALLPDVRSLGDDIVDARARLTLARHADPAPPPADLKGLEARLSDLIETLASMGLQVKGWAPLLVDFPMEHDGRLVLLCWLEGETELAWYHDADHGFPGRRRLDDL